MAGRVYICNPGSSFIPTGTENEPCKCGHVRGDHWWGGGECSESYKNGNPCRCTYFRIRTVVGGRPTMTTDELPGVTP